MAATGIESVVKFIGAGLIAIAFVSIAFNNVASTQDLNAQVNADIDSRRLAQAMEVVDHKDRAQVQLTFGVEYDTIEISGQQVVFREGEEEIGHLIFLNTSVEEQTLTRTQTVCLIKEDTIRINGTCPLGGGS